jgi:anti-sigma factor RsiW
VTPVREREDELMRYLDGELSPLEASQVERWLADSVDARRKLAALEQLREVTRARYAAAEEDAGPKLDAMWARLEGQLGAPAADAKRPAATRAAEPRGAWAAIGDWWESWRGHVATGAVAATVGALIAVLVMRSTAVDPGAGPGRGAVAEERSQVDSVAVSDGTATIMEIPADKKGAAPTTVIWITRNDPAGEDDRPWGEDPDAEPGWLEGPI